MLTAHQLDVLADPISELYARYEDSVLRDIARRLANLNLDSAAWQVQRLSESGALYDSILDKLARLTGRSQDELRSTFRKAGVKAMRFDDSIYKAAGLNPLPLNLSPAMTQVLLAGLAKTNGLVTNLVQTTAITGQDVFIRASDLAYMQVSTGAMSYTQAIKEAVNQVATEGMRVVSYPGRTDHMDVAIRRAVLTGVNQTTGELQMTRADEMGVDLVETTAHAGARNTGTGPANHEGWQGKVFSRSGNNGQYPPFVTTTGYGTGPGLMGWNCRHSFYPFFEGISDRAYSDAELNAYERKTVTYNGQEISMYEATQAQRKIEVKIREWKRRASALEAAGLPSEFETNRVRQWQARMRDFTKQTGLIRQREREQIVKVFSGAKPPAPAAPPVAPPVPKAPTKPPVSPYEFKEAKTIKEANQFAEETLGIEFADYRGATVAQANEWNNGLADTFTKFPELKPNFTGTGTTQGRFKGEYDFYYQKALENRKTFYENLGWDDKRRSDDAARTARKRATKTPRRAYAYAVQDRSDFNVNGVFFSTVDKPDKINANLFQDVANKFHPTGTASLKAVFDHEVGHMLDHFLELRNNPEFFAMYSKYSRQEVIDGLSRYATTNRAEFIAEAWGEYNNNPSPRQIAREIGDLIMREFQRKAGRK